MPKEKSILKYNNGKKSIKVSVIKKVIQKIGIVAIKTKVAFFLES